MKKLIDIFKTRLVLNILCYLLTVVYFLLAYFSGKFDLNILYNADELYLSALYNDIFVNHNPIDNWHLPAASYLFPDFIIYLFIRLIFSNIVYVVLSASILQGLIFTIAFYYLLLNCYILNEESYTSSKIYAFRFSVFANLLFTIFSVNERGVAMTDYWTVYRSYSLLTWHFGAFLMLVVSLLLVVLIFKTINSKTIKNYPRTFAIYLFCLFVIALLTTMSDKIYIVQFVVPMFVSCLVTRERFLNYSLLIIILGVIIGIFFSKFLPLYPVSNNLISSIGDFFKAQYDLLYAVGAYFYKNLLYLILLLIILIYCYRILISNCKFGINRFIKVFFLSHFVIIVIAVIFRGIGTTRYMLPIFFDIPLLMFLLTNHKSKRLFVNIIGFLSVGFAFFSTIWYMFVIYSGKSVSLDYYPKEVACLDYIASKYNLKYGIAQYWDVKKVNVLSKNGIILATVNGDLTYKNWVETNSYKRDGYDFAFIDLTKPFDYLLDAKLIYTINGAPVADLMCGHNWRVLVYGDSKLKLP